MSKPSKSDEERESKSAEEEARLAELHDLGILDTPPEAEFDELVEDASRIAGTPIALMSLIDRDRQWFKARRGLEVAETPRDIAFCSRAIEDPTEPLIIPDARTDPRFADNPLVTSDPNVAFYAGVPIVSSEGHALGTICVIDREAGDLDEDQVDALKGLSRQAAALLELRRRTQRLSSVLDRDQAERGESSLHDRLTGLPNRDALKAEISSLDPEEPASLFLVKLLRFSEVNAAVGREGGDQILCAVTRLMADQLSIDDTLARVDGTSFAALVPGVEKIKAASVARDLSDLLSRPIEASGLDPVGISVAIGTASTGAGSQIGTADLLESAEMAGAQAKRKGARATVAAGLATLDERARQSELITGLSRAITDRKLDVLAYMPVVELSSRRVVGAEALARFPGRDFEGVPVEEIISLAEANGMVGDIDQMVIEQALSDFAAGLIDAPSVGVNISPVAVSPELPDLIRNALDRNEVSPECLVVEITERVTLADNPDLKSALERLSKMGVRVAIDDFGAGATSIADLRTLPFDAVKLDRDLIAAIDGPDSRRALMIIQALTSMAQGLGIDILAEGIETELQCEKLVEAGVPFGQGFLFGRPMPAGDISVARAPEKLGAPRPIGAQMERLAGSFFDQSPDLAAMGTSERLLRVSPSWGRILGLDETDLLSPPLSSLVHPEDLPNVVDQLGALGEGTDVGTFEARLKGPEGTWHTLEWKVRRDPDTGLYLFTARDITRERRFEKERRRLRFVMETLSGLQERYIEEGVSRDWWYEALESIVALTESEYGFLGRVERDAEGNPFLVTYALTNIAWNEWSRGVWDDYQEVGLEFHNLKTLFGVTLSTGELFIANDAPHNPKRGGLPEGHPDLNHFVGIPIRGEGGLVGMAGLANRPGGYDEDLIEYLDPIFASLSQIISHDIARRRARQVEFDATSTSEAVEAVLESQDIEHALEMTNRSLEAVAPEVETNLFVIGESRERLGRLGVADPEGKDALHRGACLALTRGEPHVSQPGDDPDQICAHASPYVTTICVPVENPEEEFGVIITEDPVGPDDGDENLGERVGRLTQKLETLATALAEVARRDDLTHRALTDSLTGLTNRPAFIQAVNRALDTVDADESGFGLMMFDLDEFKLVNDELGHPAGDAALKAVGVQVKKVLRDRDTVARLGGDEFGVLITGLGSDLGLLEKTCERVREVVAETPLEGARVTASIGAVQVTDSSDSWEDIYRIADQALYESKRAGGNQLRLASDKVTDQAAD